MKEAFTSHKFASDKAKMIDRINVILAEYQHQGYQLTVRQLYYQLVARDIIPNNQRSYKNTGNLVSEARQAGYIDWMAIEDRGRTTKTPQYWEKPGDVVKAAAYSWRIDKWASQPWSVEVMVEKDALSGILQPVCSEYEVPFTANKGYSSSSALYFTAKRIERLIRLDKNILVLYLGDHDPSGVDMTRDVLKRLELYGYAQGEIEVRRLALNMDQIRRWNPPPAPAKESDSRASGYIQKHGDECWELDAVEPRELRRLVEANILDVRDEAIWARDYANQERLRTKLNRMADEFVDELDNNEEEEEL